MLLELDVTKPDAVTFVSVSDLFLYQKVNANDFGCLHGNDGAEKERGGSRKTFSGIRI
jgi:hypothetical protein